MHSDLSARNETMKQDRLYDNCAVFVVASSGLLYPKLWKSQVISIEYKH